MFGEQLDYQLDQMESWGQTDAEWEDQEAELQDLEDDLDDIMGPDADLDDLIGAYSSFFTNNESDYDGWYSNVGEQEGWGDSGWVTDDSYESDFWAGR